MAHPLVEQLRFTRGEWLRGLGDVSAEDAVKQFEPINPIAWMVAHLANHEQTTWIFLVQGGEVLVPELLDYRPGKPLKIPDVNEMWQAWHQVTAASEDYLDSLTTADLQTYLSFNGKPVGEDIGTMLHRMIYHYWYHLGEAQAVRQLLRHQDLPSFVGRFGEYTYHPE